MIRQNVLSGSWTLPHNHKIVQSKQKKNLEDWFLTVPTLVSLYGRVNNSCHLPLLTLIFRFVVRNSLLLLLTPITCPLIITFFSKSDDRRPAWTVQSNAMMQQTCIKNVTTDIIMYFIQNLQLSNSVGATATSHNQPGNQLVKCIWHCWKLEILAELREGYLQHLPQHPTQRPNCLIFCHKHFIHQSNPV